MKDNKLRSLPYFDDFLLALQVDNYSDLTVYNYERDLNVFILFLKEEINKRFDDITKQDIDQYKAYLYSSDRKTPQFRLIAKKKLSSYSVNRMLSSLRAYLRYLDDRDIPTPVNAGSIKLSRMERKHSRVAEFDELVRLIEAPSRLEKKKTIAIRNRAILELLFSTGMRISELVNLKRSQIDGSGKIFIMGKGKKQRFVYLTPRAKEHLKDYLNIRKDQNPYLFIPTRGRNANDNKKRISTNYLQDKIKKYREQLQINVPTSAHSLRHGFATYLAEKGASVAAIQILLGHESLNTTTRYVHPSDRFAETSHRRFHPLKNQRPKDNNLHEENG